jgi:hypothetical protein
MRLRNGIIALFFFAVAAVAAIVAAASRPVAPVEIRVVSVAELGTTKLVAMEFRRCNSAARFAEAHRVQLRIAGRWQPPVTLPESGDGYLLAYTNCQRLVFDMPAEADACRFSLGYRVGPRPYCQVYFFLQNHGLSQRFPMLSRGVLKCVPQQPRLRRVECELKIPTETHNESAARKGGVPSASMLHALGPPCLSTQVKHPWSKSCPVRVGP